MLRLVIISAIVAAATATFGTPDAVVGIVPGGNKNISGTIYFSKHPYGILISGTVKGLTPGLHGFHIHEKGDTSEACAAAGGHYNPLERTHGSPKDFARHAGDLGNIHAGIDGVADITIIDNHLSLNPHSATFIGKLAVVVHAGEDDLGKGGNADSLATGNAGGREGCGIIHLVERPVHHRPQPIHRAGTSSDFYRPRYFYS